MRNLARGPLATWRANVPSPAPLLPAGKQAPGARLPRAFRGASNPGGYMLCSNFQMLATYSIFFFLFKLCWPPLCGPYETHFQARLESWIASFDLWHQLFCFVLFFPNYSHSSPFEMFALKERYDLYIKVQIVLCFQLALYAVLKLLYDLHIA